MKLDYLKWIQIFILIVLFVLSLGCLIDYVKIGDQIITAKKECILLKSNRYFLTQKIALFSEPEVDYDLLETQARHVISFYYPDEKIFFWKEKAGEDLNVYYGGS